jgi:D-alanyl-D-alanine carboxypeptidase
VSAAAILPGAGIWTGTSGKSYAGTYAPPIRPQTRFSVASVTKNFCAALILQLCDEGKLTLDEPLSQCLPEWVDERRIAGRITIRQLLNHTSGVGDYVDPVTDAFMNEWTTDITAPSRKAELVTLIGDPMFAPGTSWGYCNANFILLGLIAERATGNTVLNEFHRRFFTPLQLGGMYLGGEEPLEGECAVGHNWSSGDYLNVKLMPGEPSSASILGLGHAWSAFALVATAENLARWSQALFGGAVLSEASLRAMTTDPQRTVWSGILGDPEGYGLGCAIFDSRWGHLLGVNGGNTAGHLTRMLYSPEREYALTVIVNDGSLGDFTKIDTIIAALLDLLHASTGGLGLRSPGDE